MPKLSNIARDEAKLTIEVEGDDDLVIKYHPNRATDALFMSVAGFEHFDASTAKETLESFNGALITLIEEWNLLEDDGKTVIPLTQEGLKTVYIPTKIFIFGQIKLDMSSPNHKPVQG